ncbi:MAG TPA: DUF6308 family protein [Propionibacteriaceae bacterium]|jgi:hypothetical protein
MQLPPPLEANDGTAALDLLECYYGRGAHAHHAPFTGAWFDSWDSTGTRARDVNRFTADDLLAVTFLSVAISAPAARMLLDVHRDAFSQLLAELGPDRDLVDETERWPEDWAGWRLWQKLVALPGVGPTRASKLYARKRPRLRPIYDSVVARVTGSTFLWEPLREELQARPELHTRLVGLGQQIQLPVAVSALRVFDVVTWMHGTYGHACPLATQ